MKYGPELVPKEALTLSEAWRIISDVLEAHAELRFEIMDDLADEVTAAVEAEYREHAYWDESHRAGLTRGAEAHLFLRWQLYEKRLFAYIRDPETGQVLRLPSSGWEQAQRLSTGIFSDYLCDWEDDVIFPRQASFLRGAFQLVFVLKDEFNDWFKETITKHPLAPTADNKSRRVDPYDLRHPRDHLQYAVRRAIAELYPAMARRTAYWR